MHISNSNKLLIMSGLLIVFNILLILNSFLFSEPEVVYVDKMQLFESFNMTKEMKELGEIQFNSQKSKIDSLYTIMQKSAPSEQQKLMKDLVVLKEGLNQTSQQYAFDESQKIWERLNSYINEFSTQKNYKLIIGSEKKQEVLYVDSKIDITSELITYVNSKYEGGK